VIKPRFSRTSVGPTNASPMAYVLRTIVSRSEPRSLGRRTTSHKGNEWLATVECLGTLIAIRSDMFDPRTFDPVDRRELISGLASMRGPKAGLASPRRKLNERRQAVGD
jgi:hypothetical protein